MPWYRVVICVKGKLPIYDVTAEDQNIAAALVRGLNFEVPFNFRPEPVLFDLSHVTAITAEEVPPLPKFDDDDE